MIKHLGEILNAVFMFVTWRAKLYLSMGQIQKPIGYCLMLKLAGLAAKLPFSKATLARKGKEIIRLNETVEQIMKYMGWKN